MIFFDAKQIEECLPMDDCINVMRTVFSLNLEQETLNPLRNIIPLPNGAGLMGLMPAYIKPYKVMGVKVLSVFFTVWILYGLCYTVRESKLGIYNFS